VISAVKNVAYEAVQTATNSMLQSVHFGNMENNCFFFPFSGDGTFDKFTTALCLGFGFVFGFGFALKCIGQAQ